MNTATSKMTWRKVGKTLMKLKIQIKVRRLMLEILSSRKRRKEKRTIKTVRKAPGKDGKIWTERRVRARARARE